MHDTRNLFVSLLNQKNISSLIFPLCFLLSGYLSALFGYWDLCLLGILGLILSTTLRFLGTIYSLFLLVSMGTLMHLSVGSSHLFRLGLEISYALSFLITACFFEEKKQEETALLSEQEVLVQSEENAQKELFDLQEEVQKERSIAFEKQQVLQEELDELSSEKNSLEILGDVLRATTAKHQYQAKQVQERFEDLERRLNFKQEELEELKKQKQLLEKEPLAEENRTLMEALNELRASFYEAKKINEQLVRLHAKEYRKAQELQKQLEEKALKTQTVSSEELLREKARVEGMYAQLKEQFQEKKALLNETRKEVFSLANQLETLEKDREESTYHSYRIPEVLEDQMTSLEEEKEALFEENLTLLEQLQKIALAKGQERDLGEKTSLQEAVEEALSLEKKKTDIPK